MFLTQRLHLRQRLFAVPLYGIFKFSFITYSNFRTGNVILLLGWTMVFKIVGGASPPYVAKLWQSSFPYSEHVGDALDTTTNYFGQYKNRIVMNWQTFQPQEVRKLYGKNR